MCGMTREGRGARGSHHVMARQASVQIRVVQLYKVSVLYNATVLYNSAIVPYCSVLCNCCIPHHTAPYCTTVHTIQYHTVPYCATVHTIPYHTVPHCATVHTIAYRTVQLCIPYRTVQLCIPYRTIPVLCNCAYHTVPHHTVPCNCAYHTVAYHTVLCNCAYHTVPHCTVQLCQMVVNVCGAGYKFGGVWKEEMCNRTGWWAGAPTIFTISIWICSPQQGQVLEGSEDELRGDDNAEQAPNEVGPCCHEAEQGLELVRGQDGAEAAESAASVSSKSCGGASMSLCR